MGDGAYLKPGDAEPALPEHDFDIDWWLFICVVDDCGRSKSESVRGLCGGTLELRRSSSLSPIMSGDDSRLCSVLFVMIGVFPPLSRFRCSSLRRSALRHLARRFWNQTYMRREQERRKDYKLCELRYRPALRSPRRKFNNESVWLNKHRTGINLRWQRPNAYTRRVNKLG